METTDPSPLLAFAGTFVAGFAFAIACLANDGPAGAFALAGIVGCGYEFVRAADFTLN
jgi:hypothetical protein